MYKFTLKGNIYEVICKILTLHILTKIMETVIVISDFPMLKFNNRIFSFYCSMCYSCFKPNSVILHFKRYHTNLDISVLKDKNFNVIHEELSYKSQELGNVNNLNGHFPIKPLEGFPIFKCLKCTIGNCQFFVKETSLNRLKIMKKHIKMDHPNYVFHENVFIECFCQSLSKGGGKKKFVQVSSLENESKEDEEIRPSKLNISTQTVLNISTIYDEIGFHYSDSNLNVLYDISCDNFENKHNSLFDSSLNIKEGFKKCVYQSITYLKNEGIIIKKLIGTTSVISDSIYNKNSKMLKIVERETLEKYIAYFIRFLYFLLRIKLYNLELLRESGLEISNEQYDLICKLKINEYYIFDVDDIITILNEKYLKINGKHIFFDNSEKTL